MAKSLPCGYGHVLMTAVGSVALNFYFARRVMQARAEHGVQYPALYSPTNNAFNCIQRGHQNYLENQPQFLALLLIGGLAHPRAATISGCVYLAGRLLYFRGYAQGDPKKRMHGAPFALLAQLVLLGCSVCLAVANIKHYNNGKLFCFSK